MKIKNFIRFFTALFILTGCIISFQVTAYASDSDNNEIMNDVIAVLHEQYTEEEVAGFLEQYTDEELISMYKDSMKFECSYVGLLKEIDDPEVLELLRADKYVDDTAVYSFAYDGNICAYVYLWAQFGYLEADYVYVETYNDPMIDLLDNSMTAKVTDLTVLPSGVETGITFNFCIKKNWSLVYNKTFCKFLCDCYGDMSS